LLFAVFPDLADQLLDARRRENGLRHLPQDRQHDVLQQLGGQGRGQGGLRFNGLLFQRFQ
jgi:hypothetical protein